MAVTYVSQRDQAWAIRSYPCTGLGVWLVPFISRSPAYPNILHRLRDGARMIDIGCFLGSDLRCLAFDGAPTANMYGVDIVSHWDTGFALYRDQDSFKARFIETDMLSENHPHLEALQGTADIVSISAVLHQWDWDNQIIGAKRIAALTRPGALVIGYQIGNIDGKVVMNKSLQLPQWRHDSNSFSKLWQQVGVETSTAWKTEARLVEWESLGWDPEDTKWLEPGDKVLDFVVTRIS